MKKVKALLAIIIFLAVVALIVNWAVDRDTAKKANTDQGGITISTGDNTSGTAPAVPTPEATLPVVTAVPPTIPPEVTPVPTPEAAVTPTPAPTPVPQVSNETPKAEEGYGASLGAGTFASDTGVGLNLTCSWSAKTLNANEITITVSVAATHYSLYTCSLPCTITAAGLQGTLNGPAISYDGPGAATTEFGSRTFTVSMAKGQTITVPVNVVWGFLGTYSGKTLNELSAATTIVLSR